SFRVTCPHEGCGWGGSLVPSRMQGGTGAEIAEMQRAWFHCRAASTAGMKTLQVEMRPVLTPEVFAFPDALAEVNCLKCEACGHWICLDSRIELDDNPEIDLNPE